MDVCASLNGLVACMDYRMGKLLCGQKRYPHGQFIVETHLGLAMKVAYELFRVWGYVPVECNSSDGRKVLQTDSMFLLENTIASPNNQLCGECVARKFSYLDSKACVGKRYSTQNKRDAIMTKDP